MRELTNRVAAITGAASGMGQALAIGLAREGCHVAIADLNEEGLKETVKTVEGMGGVITSTVTGMQEIACMLNNTIAS